MRTFSRLLGVGSFFKTLKIILVITLNILTKINVLLREGKENTVLRDVEINVMT